MNTSEGDGNLLGKETLSSSLIIIGNRLMVFFRHKWHLGGAPTHYSFLIILHLAIKPTCMEGGYNSRDSARPYGLSAHQAASMTYFKYHPT